MAGGGRVFLVAEGRPAGLLALEDCVMGVMGMSQDFETAIACGTTALRIGHAVSDAATA